MKVKRGIVSKGGELVPKSDRFSLLLHSKKMNLNKNNKTTKFKNTFKLHLYLKGDYEVALETIHFSNLKEADLGQIEIGFTPSNRPPFVYAHSIFCKMGISYKELFEEINDQISEVFYKKEYARRLNLRKKNHIPLSISNFIDGTEEILLPVDNNYIYDSDVNEQIRDMTPKLIYLDGFLTFKMNNDFYIKFYGNLKNLITELTEEKYFNGSIPINLGNFRRLPDFNTCLILTDIIENENNGENEAPILKFLNLDCNNISSFKMFDLQDHSFKRLKKDKQLVKTIKEVNISIQTDFNHLLEFDQGEVTIQLHFRKI